MGEGQVIMLSYRPSALASSFKLQTLLLLAFCQLQCLAQKNGFCHMFYTNAESNLEKDQLSDMQEVLSVNPAGYTALMYIDRPAQIPEGGTNEAMQDLFDASGALVTVKKTNPLYAKMVQRDGKNVWVIEKELPEQDSLKESSLLAFAQWAWKQCPANTFRVISMSMHGGGMTGMSYDETADHSRMTTPEIKSVFSKLLTQGLRYDIIGFDECLMGSFSVGKALMGTADYLLASEPMEPGYGWDYTKINTQAPDPEMYGKSIIDAMLAQHQGPNQLVLIDLNRFGDVMKSYHSFVEKITNGLRGGDEVLLVSIDRARENAAEYPTGNEAFNENYNMRAETGVQQKSGMDLGSFLRNLEPASTWLIL
eukprot:TRINITY_DN13735_c0_g1_i4.p1 TRINITY_DN13735_c0_g1~~TRINITY_DN13735_c0_g1_i4.p1  ORF type:complete len:390 (-),score=86.20 TRINITY_DN13735_c0_g1_i4:30-1127(-)